MSFFNQGFGQQFPPFPQQSLFLIPQQEVQQQQYPSQPSYDPSRPPNPLAYYADIQGNPVKYSPNYNPLPPASNQQSQQYTSRQQQQQYSPQPQSFQVLPPQYVVFRYSTGKSNNRTFIDRVFNNSQSAITYAQSITRSAPRSLMSHSPEEEVAMLAQEQGIVINNTMYDAMSVAPFEQGITQVPGENWRVAVVAAPSGM
jgi:hypothetical protein